METIPNRASDAGPDPRPSAPAKCVHDNYTIREFDHGRDPETGYHDAGTIVICHDCGEAFTDEEFRKELDAIENSFLLPKENASPDADRT